MTEADQKFDHWAIVELLGHVKVAGRVTEEERFGSKLGRIDIPNGETFVTQYFGGGSVYRLTPCSEEIARSVANQCSFSPAHSWELPAPKAVTMIESQYDQDDFDDEHDGEEIEEEDLP